MIKPIYTEISDSVLHFAPESGPLSFAITVYNNSPQFASFQVVLVAAGVDANQRDWYRLSPSVSAKIPPGDQTCFQAHVLSVPPIPGGFTGTMNLTVRVYSTELRNEDRKDLRLIITGDGLLAPRVTIPKSTYKAHPQEQVAVLANIYNPNRKSLEVVLELTGLKPEWFPDGVQKSMMLVPSEEKQVTFLCQLPLPTHAPSSRYPLNLKVLQPAIGALPQQLQLEVFPQGFVEFHCDPIEQWIPEKSARWRNPAQGITTYQLGFNNRSNLGLFGIVSVVDEDELRQQRRHRRLENPPPDAEAAAAASLPAGLTLVPERVFLQPGETGFLQLTVRRRLPWLGWSRFKRLQVQASLVDAPLDLRNENQTLELHILPVIPFWLQVLGGLVGLCLVAFIWWLMAQRGHTNAVHTVQFNGAGTEVVSGASDQTLRRWQVTRRRLRPQPIIYRGDKAVRVIQYRPVNNDWVAAGLENGTIQVHSLLSGRTSTLESARDDRVFDLAFDQDARTLWSAHGSGLILQWALMPDLGIASQRPPQQIVEADFAVSALALTGDADNLLAIGGRYQGFVVVDLDSEEAVNIPYRSGTQTEYINSLETAAEYPTLLAAGDSQGYISLWNLETCLAAMEQCDPIDEWSAHGEQAVRSVALSADGCYLVSGGDDGRVRLWQLSGAGERRLDWADRDAGTVLRRARQPINSVDIRQQARQLRVVSGGDDRTVRLNRVRLRANDQCRANR
ncbi:MAG: hypothetical protein F6J95_026955 [Leptolyngbya sp. SIO1E4]|nr:hypothetical protein [Leptolyngbya sp. SIO1E4]